MARQFTGSEYGALTASMLDPNNPYTMLAWIKKSTLDTSDQFIFGGRRASSFERSHGILYRGSSGTTLNLYQNGGSAQYLAGAVPSLDVWVPVIITRVGGGTGSQTTSINVDGATVAGANSQTTLAETPVVAVGASQTSGVIDKHFVGLIGAVAKWDAVLSAPDIASLIAGADPSTIDSGNLYDSWVFDSDTGSTSTGVNSGVITWTGSPAYVADSPFASGPTITDITDPVSDSLSVTLSEATVNVDESVVDGNVMPITTSDDTTFDVTLNRSILPPHQAVMQVRLVYQEADVVSANVELVPPPGYGSITVTSPVFTEDSIFYGYTGDAPIAGDIIMWSDSPNTSVDATGVLIQTVASSVDLIVWQDSSYSYGATTVFDYTPSSGATGIVKSLIKNIVKSIVK
jgi:hypothetical protein